MEALDPFVLGETLFVFTMLTRLVLDLFFITRQRPEPSGVLRISSDWDDLMGAKIKMRKNPWGFQQKPKISREQKITPNKSHIELRSRDTRALQHICRMFEIPKKSLFKSTPRPPKKILAKFFYHPPPPPPPPPKKKSRNRKFPTQKNSFDDPRHLKSGVPPPGSLRVFLTIAL